MDSLLFDDLKVPIEINKINKEYNRSNISQLIKFDNQQNLIPNNINNIDNHKYIS